MLLCRWHNQAMSWPMQCTTNRVQTDSWINVNNQLPLIKSSGNN